MRGCLAAAVGALAALAVLVAWAAARAARRYDAFLEGMWGGNVAFLARARLRDFQLYIGPRDADGLRQGYLVMADPAGALVANAAVEIRSRPAYASALRAALRDRGDVYAPGGFEVRPADAGGGPGPLPAQLRASVSMLDGTLTLYDRDAVYAFLEKDTAASAVAAEAARQPN